MKSKRRATWLAISMGIVLAHTVPSEGQVMANGPNGYGMVTTPTPISPNCVAPQVWTLSNGHYMCANPVPPPLPPAPPSPPSGPTCTYVAGVTYEYLAFGTPSNSHTQDNPFPAIWAVVVNGQVIDGSLTNEEFGDPPSNFIESEDFAKTSSTGYYAGPMVSYTNTGPGYEGHTFYYQVCHP